jgi:hypothetical protein
MKKFKKLIPAFCAMLVSAAMLGTSTYAWFSVNKKVEANGMSVTAQANTQYFVVLNSIDGGFTAEGKTETTTTTLKNPTAGGIGGHSTNVYPAAYTTAELSLASGTGTGVEANNWYTGGVSADAQTTEGENSKFTTLTTLGADVAATFTTKTDYFVAYTFYVGLADKTDSCSAKLKFTATGATNAAKIAGFTVQSSDPGAGAAKYTSYAGKTTEAVETTDTFDFVAKNGATSAKYVTVTVYVYIDGTNAEIMSKNLKAGGDATKLTGSIGVQVDADIQNN